MKRQISEEELASLCDARDNFCGFCEADECSWCVVPRLIDDAYNECKEVEDTL